MQQVHEPPCLHQVGAAIVAGQGKHSFVSFDVEVPVPDEMHCVPLSAKQQVLQCRPGCFRCPAHINEPFAAWPGKRAS